MSDVYSTMRASILKGEIEPGTRINIDAVARSMGVSQTPVREVLQRLEGDNLVVYSPGTRLQHHSPAGPCRIALAF